MAFQVRDRVKMTPNLQTWIDNQDLKDEVGEVTNVFEDAFGVVRIDVIYRHGKRFLGMEPSQFEAA
ncbi:MAG: hypothetical protein AB3N20_18140 [Rhizobiaceae bacterium]